ncbi:MAG: Asp-tRNA(Asn)/Glu-tRNA(Gln) amidotransferase subunit GatC [Chloroflexi bacterium]|nr:Asp-tRNA(Asn)/Glu-tRNA(Gln) amidotransferase subunit GatC [Chloroflexota bacterium]
MTNDSRLTEAEVRHIALLARIGMTDEDVDNMRHDLSNIMDQFDVLNQVDTEGVEPTGHSVDVTSVMREDTARASLPKEDVLANVPNREGDRIRVKAVLDNSG